MQFRKIEEIESMPAKTQIDVLGVVEAVDQAGEISRRDGSQVTKRALTIKDDSNRSIEVTLWDSYALSVGNEIEAVRQKSHAQPVTIRKILAICFGALVHLPTPTKQFQISQGKSILAVAAKGQTSLLVKI